MVSRKFVEYLKHVLQERQWHSGSVRVGSKREKDGSVRAFREFGLEVLKARYVCSCFDRSVGKEGHPMWLLAEVKSCRLNITHLSRTDFGFRTMKGGQLKLQ